MKPLEERIQKAIQEYHAQLHLAPKFQLPQAHFARENHLFPSVLSNRLRGITHTHTVGAAHLQTLTPAEEVGLVQYITRLSLLGPPPAPGTVREVAFELCQNRLRLSPDPPSFIPAIGKNWLGKFKKRHPEVTTAWSRTLEKKRYDGTSPEKLVPWFSELGALFSENHYTPDRIFNMDETGYSMGSTQSSQVMTVVLGRQKEKEEKKKKGDKAIVMKFTGIIHNKTFT